MAWKNLSRQQKEIIYEAFAIIRDQILKDKDFKIPNIGKFYLSGINIWKENPLSEDFGLGPSKLISVVRFRVFHGWKRLFRNERKKYNSGCNVKGYTLHCGHLEPYHIDTLGRPFY